MSNLKKRKSIIREKRKTTEFRDFLKEVTSWTPMVFNRKNGLISRWGNNTKLNICSIEEFNELRDGLINKGKEYDFEKGFFDNFKNLFLETPLPNLLHYGTNNNSDYSDVVLYSKNCYLSNIIIKDCENIFYSFITRGGCENIFNSLFSIARSTNIYFSRGIISSFNVFYSSYIKNSNNIWFSSNLTGCAECIFCDDLQNSNYFIKNKKYKKEDYFIEKEKILKNKKEFLNYYKKVNNIGNCYNNENSTGNFISESVNIENGSYVTNSKDARNVIFIGSPEGNENFYDVSPGGGGGGSDFVGVCGAGDGSSNLYCSVQVGSSSNIFYSYFIESCSYCIGCVGLKNKNYCIFNKQYKKEEWEILADRIFLQMNKAGILGKFFPGELNPFRFNDTMAGMLGNFTKQEVEKDGYMWRNEKVKVDIPEGAELISVNELKDFQGFDNNGDWRINPEILKKVIKDSKGNYYRVVKQEYDFLIKYRLPLSEIHWMDRMKLNLGV